jgi:quinol monooxygenase YgiN/catechol 2,3-dioxygenase-like lactoylglutathione lyase family enzyme
MFCVVYQWKVKPGKEDEFRETWRTITEAIFRQHGSLGSRLHKEDDGTWVAYAQWLSPEQWKNHAETLGVELVRSRQAACLSEGPTVLLKLHVTDDLLATAPYEQTHVVELPETVIAEVATLRVARPTDRMEEVIRFYRDGIGLQELGRFEDHDGFDGVMLGAPNSPYHLEFTRCQGHVAGPAPTQDNLLVFYVPDQKQWQDALGRMQTSGYQPVQSFNPYWDRRGRTFEDPDGYRVVIQNASWDI